MGQGLNEKGTPPSLIDKHKALLGPSASKMQDDFEKFYLDDESELNGALNISKRSTKVSSNLLSSFVDESAVRGQTNSPNTLFSDCRKESFGQKIEQPIDIRMTVF